VIHVVLLRGINLGPNRRVAMPRLREVLSDAGFGDVRTYVQSGNVVLDSDLSSARVADRSAALIASEFGFEVDVIVRTRDEIAEVVRRNPLGTVASNPKRYQVSFLAAEPDPARVARLDQAAAPSERVVAIGREIYAWHPEGVARSKLWSALAAKDGLGVPATARNWTTVTTLLQMADESSAVEA
jgi:uncharacterized protein (DUF1697 family)